MSTNTTNYILVKPDPTDRYDISVFNSNYDKIDAAIKGVATLAGDKALLDTTTMTTDQKSNLVKAIIAAYNKSVSDDQVGTKIINQAVSLPTAANTPGLLTTVISWFGRRFKEILGTTDWHSAVPTATIDGVSGVTVNLAKLAAMLNQSLLTSSSVTFNTVTGTNGVFNAKYGDLAEWFERGEDTNPGDVIIIDPVDNKYYRCNQDNSMFVVGVHSTRPGMFLGGEELPDMLDNINKFIPIALAGRVPVNTTGIVFPGCVLVGTFDAKARCIRTDDVKMPGTTIGKALYQISENQWMMQVMMG